MCLKQFRQFIGCVSKVIVMVRISGNLEGLVLTYSDSADEQVACGKEELTKKILYVQFHNLYSPFFGHILFHACQPSQELYQKTRGTSMYPAR